MCPSSPRDDAQSASALRKTYLRYVSSSAKGSDISEHSYLLLIIVIAVVAFSLGWWASPNAQDYNLSVSDDFIWTKLSRYGDYLEASRQLTREDRRLLQRWIETHSTVLASVYVRLGGDDSAFVNAIHQIQ
eukprot:Rmarinus@m.25277